MKPSQAFRWAALNACLVAFCAGPTLGQVLLKPPYSRPRAPRAAQPITLQQAAELLIQAGKFDEAKKVLLALEKQDPRDSQTQFLLAMVSMTQKDYQAAIHRLRQILVREPGVLRVRLELARAFYLENDYDNAERQFRFARAGDTPDAVKANIDRYLYAIRLARRFSYNISVAAAPDTNLNAGPSISAVSIFGLPFQLSEQARQQSGVGATLDAGGEWSPSIADHVRMRLGAQLHRNDYSGSAFDDMTLSTYAGPKFIGSRWEISPLLTGFRRWYGNQFYNDGFGGTLQGTYYPMPKLGVTASIGGQEFTFLEKGMNGPASTLSLSAFYTLDTASVFSSTLSTARQSARLPVYSNTAWQLQLGYYRDLPGGFSVAVQPSFVDINYDAQYVAFGNTRRDRQWSSQISLLNRRIDFWGFTPAWHTLNVERQHH